MKLKSSSHRDLNRNQYNKRQFTCLNVNSLEKKHDFIGNIKFQLESILKDKQEINDRIEIYENSKLDTQQLLQNGRIDLESIIQQQLYQQQQPKTCKNPHLRLPNIKPLQPNMKFQIDNKDIKKQKKLNNSEKLSLLMSNLNDQRILKKTKEVGQFSKYLQHIYKKSSMIDMGDPTEFKEKFRKIKQYKGTDFRNVKSEINLIFTPQQDFMRKNLYILDQIGQFKIDLENTKLEQNSEILGNFVILHKKLDPEGTQTRFLEGLRIT